MFYYSAPSYLSFKKNCKILGLLPEHFHLIPLCSLFSGIFQLCFWSVMSYNICFEKEQLNTLKYFAFFSLALWNVTIKKSVWVDF